MQIKLKMKNEEVKIDEKMFRSKKGINDISIIAVILSIFLMTGVAIPFVNAEFDTNFANLDEDTLTQNVRNDAESVTAISAFTVLVTVVKLAIFDFGNTLGLPFWLDIIYTLLAVIFVLVIARNIWVGGGA